MIDKPSIIIMNISPKCVYIFYLAAYSKVSTFFLTLGSNSMKYENPYWAIVNIDCYNSNVLKVKC